MLSLACSLACKQAMHRGHEDQEWDIVAGHRGHFGRVVVVAVRFDTFTMTDCHLCVFGYIVATKTTFSLCVRQTHTHAQVLQFSYFIFLSSLFFFHFFLDLRCVSTFILSLSLIRTHQPGTLLLLLLHLLLFSSPFGALPCFCCCCYLQESISRDAI